ncbi:hypothetical protein TH9_11470 [Thalassospira xiamenensis]|uniref:DUF6615 family protein n=1 Tax=Thalassospira xiamenensis TaxID=220697 RepID=UPI000E07DC3C|nr:DUF6615 family protein [Thalassospira xiamenensis]RCK33488.1 hypothetical protein TH9_11470 [Thalassospira xiamenensis]
MLCSFSRTFPRNVEKFLRNESRLRRRFREETVTDLLVGGILGIGASNLIVDFPDEVKTGADMEWVFYDAATNSFFRIFIQAKRSFGRGKQWKRHSVRELFHRTKSTKKLQSDVLINCVKKYGTSSYPLYFIYNSGTTCTLARNDKVQNIEGVNVVDGYFINNRVKHAAHHPKPSSIKSLKELHRQFMPLSALLCLGNNRRGIIGRPMNLGSRSEEMIARLMIASSIPTPEDVLSTVREFRLNTIESMAKLGFDKDEVERWIPMPKLSQQVPAYIQRLMDGEPVGEKDAGISLIFISDSSFR